MAYKRRPPKDKPYDKRRKLSFHDVDMIKDLMPYMKDKEIAKGYPVTLQEINHIRHGKAWAWV